MSVDKFASMVHYIIDKCGHKGNVGKTVLYKLCYFSDFDYYELYEEHLTGVRYFKNAHGPAPNFNDYVAAIDKLERAGAIAVYQDEYYNRPQKHYVSLRKPDMSIFTENEVKVIDSVIDRLSDKSAKDISAWSHEDTPWRIAENGEELDYEAVFYRSPKTSVRIYDEDN